MNSSTTTRPIRTTLSFKQNEQHLLDVRDQLCKHYRLNKSDLTKFLYRKEFNALKNSRATYLY